MWYPNNLPQGRCRDYCQSQHSLHLPRYPNQFAITAYQTLPRILVKRNSLVHHHLEVSRGERMLAKTQLLNNCLLAQLKSTQHKPNLESGVNGDTPNLREEKRDKKQALRVMTAVPSREVCRHRGQSRP
jgi:hypothetical protein